MITILWNTRGYFFWLMAISLFCWILERVMPWRPGQKAFRKEIGQDFFWLIFNGHYFGLLSAFMISGFIGQMGRVFPQGQIPSPNQIQLLGGTPIEFQFAAVLVLQDFLEWCVHNLLHRLPWLWEFHKLHHSIQELDWIGNMRFHWMEIVVYKSLTYLPIVMLGVHPDVILWVAIVSTLIGHLNHSNLNLDWGIFRYVINSPRFHVWHHDVILRGDCGKNFGIVFSVWDWLFGTAYLPSEGQPARLGFEGMEKFPKGLWQRFVYPLFRR